MNRKFMILFVATAISFNFAACDSDNKDNDNTKPIVVINEPTAGDSLKPGTSLHFDAVFTDDVELKNYKVDIHSAEGHSHSKATVSDSTWSFQKTFNINGKKNTTVHEHIDIPANAKEGAYHLVVYCTDAAGNETIAYEEFILSNDAAEQSHE